MKTLNLNQMEDVQGGGAAGCAVGVVAGVALFTAAMLAAPVTAGAAVVAVIGWHTSILTGCLL